MQSKLKKILVIISETIRSLFLLIVSRFILSLPIHNKTYQIKKIIIIKLDAIGDFILWLDAAEELKRLYPTENYEITLLGDSKWTPLAKELPCFDRVWILDRFKYLRNPIYCYKILQKIHDEGFDIAINPTFSREFQLGDVIVKVSGASERIGSQGCYDHIMRWQKCISDSWYTTLVPAQDKPLMELIRNAEFIRALGSRNFLADIPRIPLISDVPDTFHVKNYYVIFPGAGSTGRQWPLAHFKDVAEKFYNETGWTGVICGGPGEEALGEKLVEGGAAHLLNWIGRTSLPELVAVITGAHVVISNETSAVHIAAAVSTPAVCILGGGHFGRFVPYQLEVETERPMPVPVVNLMDCFGCNWEFCQNESLNGAVPCINNITVENVWNSVSEILERQVVTSKNDISRITE